MSSTFLDPLNIVPTLGLVIGMMVGLVGIWNTIKNQKREVKKDIEASNQSLENRLKEFFEARYKVVDAQTASINQRIDRQVGDLKESVKENGERIMRHIGDREAFFKDWIQRVEDEIDPRRHPSSNSRTQRR